MTRRRTIICLVAVSAVLAVAQSVAGSGQTATTVPALADQIRQQTAATQAALALVENIWVPRVAGLGVGLAVGLVGGGVLAYVVRGESR